MTEHRSRSPRRLRSSPQKGERLCPTARRADSASPVQKTSSTREGRSASSSGSSRSSAPRRPPAPAYKHRRTAGEVRRCKKGKRSDIKVEDWDKYGYALRPEVLSRSIKYDESTVPIPRVHRKDITPEWFYEHVAKKQRPIIVEGVADHWPAMQRWTIEALEERFKNIMFKVAKDDKGKKLRTKFKYFADYIRNQQDDSPLYLFETNVDDDATIRQLCYDYEIPDIFPHDFFGLVNQDARPPYRWFCIGPKRSGTTVHQDPLGTAAWNVVTHGCKHWVIMEPKEHRKHVKGKDVIKKGEDDEAVMYFDFILPRIKKKYPDMKIYEGLQRPGEAIFVPGDWWHGVVNTEDCVAITQNYCGPDNFDEVWRKTRKQREKVAYLWLRNMKKFAPALYERAIELNKKDGFRMRHDRPAGEKLSDLSSSSSESSSDSTSDDAEDLEPRGLEGAVGSTPVGHFAYRKQGPHPPPPEVAQPAKHLPSPLPGKAFFERRKDRERDRDRDRHRARDRDRERRRRSV